MQSDKSGPTSPEGDDAAGVSTAQGPAAAQPAAIGDMQGFIGRQLRAVYDDIARQPVPDRFLELMKQLETKTGGG